MLAVVLTSLTFLPLYSTPFTQGPCAFPMAESSPPSTPDDQIVARQLPWPAEGPLNIYVGPATTTNVMRPVKQITLPDGTIASFTQYPGHDNHVHVWGVLPSTLTITYQDGTSETIPVFRLH